LNSLALTGKAFLSAPSEPNQVLALIHQTLSAINLITNLGALGAYMCSHLGKKDMYKNLHISP
jgi:hypothetical protein